MIDKLFDNPYTAFFVVATGITILVLLSGLFLELCVLLWKSTLISYILFIIFAIMAAVYKHSSFGETPFYEIPYRILATILLVPGMLIYGLIPGKVKPCPSNFDEFGIFTCAFLFYAIAIWGIMKIIKHSKEMKTEDNKEEDKVGQKPLEGIDPKGV